VSSRSAIEAKGTVDHLNALTCPPGLFNALFFGGIALTESAMQQVLQITL
jgi:hypothetical protein